MEVPGSRGGAGGGDVRVGGVAGPRAATDLRSAGSGGGRGRATRAGVGLLPLSPALGDIRVSRVPVRVVRRVHHSCNVEHWQFC